MTELPGKVAVITGGASGIGLAMAKAFLGEGAKVVIADIRQDHLDAAAAAIKEMGGEIHTIRLDVTDRAAMAAAADEVERQFGKIHILCNNAGVNIIRPIDEATFEDWDFVLDVNLGGLVNGLTTFIPRIKAHGEGGHIINTSSIAGIIAGPGTAIYSATKFAIRGVSEAMLYDLLPHGIGVSVICPGTVATNLGESEEFRPERYAGAPDEAARENRTRSDALFRKVLPLGMDPAEVARKVVAGVRRDDFYIFTHPECTEEFREAFDRILAAQPDAPPDPERMKLEEGRRQRKRDILKQAGKE